MHAGARLAREARLQTRIGRNWAELTLARAREDKSTQDYLITGARLNWACSFPPDKRSQQFLTSEV